MTELVINRSVIFWKNKRRSSSRSRIALRRENQHNILLEFTVSKKKKKNGMRVKLIYKYTDPKEQDCITDSKMGLLHFSLENVTSIKLNYPLPSS